ncbi:hypothetical protein Hypma_005218, partial [Hypsizygus marmoreus]
MSHGKVHVDGIGISHSAHDADAGDSTINWCLWDRDMMMRYYWGFRVGHVYAHKSVDTWLRSPGVGVTVDDAQPHPVQKDLLD